MINKKCKKCNTSISKISNFWDIFTLKSGRIIECPTCQTRYQTNKTIRIFGKIYNNFSTQFPILFLVIVFSLYGLGLNLGGEAWLYSIGIYFFIELIVMMIIPLKEINDEK